MVFDLFSQVTKYLTRASHSNTGTAVALCASSLLGDVSSGVNGSEDILEVYLSSRLDASGYGYNMGSLSNIDNARFDNIVERVSTSLFDDE